MTHSSHHRKIFTVPVLLAALLTPGLANARNFVLGLGTCQNDLGGTWDLAAKTCTVSNYTLKIANTLTVSAPTRIVFGGAFVNKGEIVVEAGGALTVSVGGSLKNKGNVTLDGDGLNLGEIDNVDDGAFVSTGAFTNEGAIHDSDLGALTNSGGTFDNYGEITNFDVGTSILNLEAGEFHNRGGTITVEAGVLSNEGASTITNQSGGTVLIEWIGSFDNVLDSSLVNREQGSIENHGIITNSTGAGFDNYGTALNYGTLYNSGDAEVYNACLASFVNIHLFENWDTALLVNDGEFNNDDTVSNYCDGTIENHVTWDGGIDNYGGDIVNTGTLNGSVTQHGCVPKG